MVEYGTGISLDEDFDFQVDASGDVKSDSGLRELAKDLSLNVTQALKYGEGIDRPERVADGGVLGDTLDSGLLSDIEMSVAKVVSDDVRVDSVLTVDADVAESQENFVRVECTAQIDVQTEDFEFVIPAS